MKNNMLIVLLMMGMPVCAMEPVENDTHTEAILRAAQEEHARSDDPTLIQLASKADQWYQTDVRKEFICRGDGTPEKRKQQVDDLLAIHANLARAEWEMIQEEACDQSPKKRIEIIKTTLYAHAPQKVQMLADQIAQHPKAAQAVGFATAEGCSWLCCPGLAYAANLVLAGWVGRIFYDEVSKKQKEL